MAALLVNINRYVAGALSAGSKRFRRPHAWAITSCTTSAAASAPTTLRAAKYIAGRDDSNAAISTPVFASTTSSVERVSRVEPVVSRTLYFGTRPEADGGFTRTDAKSASCADSQIDRGARERQETPRRNRSNHSSATNRSA